MTSILNTATTSESRPCVSVILAVRNETAFIEATLQSLSEQTARNFELEILVIDGMSEDGTRQKVTRIAERDHRIRLLENVAKTAPAAFNVGLSAAKGEYVCILGAHALYPQEYISVCFEELLAHGVIGCSGKVITRPASNSVQARLAAWTLAHRFASSGRSVRTQPEGYAQTIPFPVMRKEALLKAGGYDESLIRNQDNDMNQRLREGGHRLFLTGKTRCFYIARPDLNSLLRHAWRTGLWNAISLKKNPASMSLRHFVPLFFVSTLLLLTMISLPGVFTSWPGAQYAATALAVLVGIHWGLGVIAGIETSLREQAWQALLLPATVFIFHLVYGAGTLSGVLLMLRNLTRQNLSSVWRPARESAVDR